MADSDNGAGLLFVAAIGLGIFAWNKIDNLEKQRDALTEQVDSLQSKLNDVKEKASTLEASSDALKAQMERFSSEDWKDVVPDAQQASDQVGSDEDDLKEAADDN